MKVADVNRPKFFYLGWPDKTRGPLEYGDPAWANIYGVAEWSDEMEVESIVCPVTSLHNGAGKRLGNLKVILPAPPTGDFMWTWVSDCLVNDYVITSFRDAGLTGFEVRPVTVVGVKDAHAIGEVPRLFEFVCTGRGGEADPASGIRRIYEHEACGLVRYSSFTNGIIVDTQEWDGSDFFAVTGYPGLALVTERVSDLIVKRKFTNCVLVPAERLQWGDSTRPEDIDWAATEVA